jgi:hypothetical protein
MNVLSDSLHGVAPITSNAKDRPAALAGPPPQIGRRR